MVFPVRVSREGLQKARFASGIRLTTGSRDPWGVLLPGVRPASRLPEASLTRGHAVAHSASSVFRAIQRLERANSVTRWAPFFARPR